MRDFWAFSFGVPSDSPSSFKLPPPTVKPATHQPNCSFNQTVMQSRTTLSVNLGSERGRIDIEGQDYKAESCVHLTNGYYNSGTPTASAVDVCSLREETEFADFTVFTEQVVHPWCCGFSSAEKLEGRGINSLNRPGEHTHNSQQDICVDAQLRPQDCTEVRHCEKRDETLVLPTQDHHQQPQETAEALVFPSDDPYLVAEGSDRDNQVCRRQSFDTFQTLEIQEDGGLQEDRVNSVWQTCSVYDSVSEDLLSCCDNLSFDGPSADLEPNVSSLGSEEQTDWDQSEDGEAAGNWEEAQDNIEELTQSKTEKDFQLIDPSASQETLVTANQPQSGTHTEDKFADFSDCTLDFHREPGDVPTGDEGILILGTLPSSDSFADFCTANTQDDGEGSWSEFKDLKVQELGRTWTWTREHTSSLQTDRGTVDWTEQYEVTGRISCQVGYISLISYGVCLY